MAALIALVGGSVILTLLVICIVGALCYYVITQLLPQPVQKIALVILVVVLVVWLLSLLGVHLP
jgi:hypothetical protein